LGAGINRISVPFYYKNSERRYLIPFIGKILQRQGKKSGMRPHRNDTGLYKSECLFLFLKTERRVING